MLSGNIRLSELAAVERWQVDVHVHRDDEALDTKYALIPLRDLVTESKKAVDPTADGIASKPYIGLEHVISRTGELAGVLAAGEAGVKSRSKVYEPGSLLFGRLRPKLRKAVVVGEDESAGICSTEFLVLEVDRSKISPVVLREILVSNRVAALIERLQAGAALPRVAAKDFLSLEIPVPGPDEQAVLEAQILDIRRQRQELTEALRQNDADTETLIRNVFE